MDVHYQIGHKVLKSLATLASQAQNTLIEDELTDYATIQFNSVQFALIYLNKAVIALYFAIQEIHKFNLQDIYNGVDDFYMFNMADNTHKPDLKITEPNIKVTSIAKSDNKPFGFGYKGDKDKLKQLIQLLCNYHNLLDEAITKQQDFCDLLTTNNIYEKRYRIQFGCNTNLAVYVLEKLKISTPHLKPANIDKSNYFLLQLVQNFHQRSLQVPSLIIHYHLNSAYKLTAFSKKKASKTYI
jgi:hypothetical protein